MKYTPMRSKLSVLLIFCSMMVATSYGEGKLKQSNILCVNDDVRLAANNTPNDIWFSANVGIASCDSTGRIYGLAPGTVTIGHIFTINGVTDTNFHELTVVAEGDCERAVSVEVYPNPNHGQFTVHLVSPVNEWAKTLLIDAAGKRVRAYKIMTNKKTDMPLQAQTGVYFLIVETNNTRMVKKVLVEGE